jgi:hypothetical protein
VSSSKSAAKLFGSNVLFSSFVGFSFSSISGFSHALISAISPEFVSVVISVLSGVFMSFISLLISEFQNHSGYNISSFGVISTILSFVFNCGNKSGAILFTIRKAHIIKPTGITIKTRSHQLFFFFFCVVSATVVFSAS